MHHEITEEGRGENRNSQPCIMSGLKCGQTMGAFSQASQLSQLPWVLKPWVPPHHENWKEAQCYKLLLLCCPVRTLLNTTSWQQDLANVTAELHQFSQGGTTVQ